MTDADKCRIARELLVLVQAALRKATTPRERIAALVVAATWSEELRVALPKVHATLLARQRARRPRPHVGWVG